MMDFISRKKSQNRHNDQMDDRFVSQLRVCITFDYLYYYSNYYLRMSFIYVILYVCVPKLLS